MGALSILSLAWSFATSRVGLATLAGAVCFAWGYHRADVACDARQAARGARNCAPSSSSARARRKPAPPTSRRIAFAPWRRGPRAPPCKPKSIDFAPAFPARQTRPPMLPIRNRNRSPLSSLAVLLTAISLAACAGSTPPVTERPQLPPPSSAQPAPLPQPIAGKDKGVFALENRASAIVANRGVEACQAHYSNVLRDFSATH
jgi:hypothetical protein